MNKTAIKNFAIWARKKLITDITYRAGLMGITEKGIEYPLSQSTGTVQFFDIGTKEPYSISGVEIDQRRRLVDLIKSKEKESDYQAAFKSVVEEVAYTWFNRLIAIRFMEVNNYLPSRIRVLSSESENKVEPDIVTHALELDFDFSAAEKERIIQLKLDNKLDDLFRMLFIKQCNALNDNLPELFEKTSDYSELLLNVSFTDKDGVVYHLVNDISEDDFNITKEGQIEIIGWLYQYYNTEPKDETFALLKKNVKITKERIPAATQLFTPEWIVKYMVENSLGRLWVEGHPNEELKANWKYYLEEAEQEEDVKKQLEQIRNEYKTLKPEDIKVIDPAMGSGHILVYAFDVLMQIYESAGYTRRDAARSIVENNLYGLDIDTRAYQLAYFAVMMKAREYNRRILEKENSVKCNFHVIQESNGIKREQLKYFGSHLSDIERNTAQLQIEDLLDTMIDAKELGSIIKVKKYNWVLIKDFLSSFEGGSQQTFDLIGIDDTKEELLDLVEIGRILASKFDVVTTNPPYMGSSGMGDKLSAYVKRNYPESKMDLFAVFIEKCTEFSKKNRFQSMITQHAFMFLSSYESLRIKLLNFSFINMLHLGARAFEEIGGEVVQTTAFTLFNNTRLNYKAKFVRLVDYKNQYDKEKNLFNQRNVFLADKILISKVPRFIFAYWISNTFVSVFNFNRLDKYALNICKGGYTGNNDKYLRLWHEVSYNDIDNKWKKYSKGGKFRKWYGNSQYVIYWKDDGKELKNDPRAGVGASKFYQKEHLVWSGISTGLPSFRYDPLNVFFDDVSPAVIFKSNVNWKILGLLNSMLTAKILEIIAPTMHFQAGDIKLIPVSDRLDILEEDLVKENVAVTKEEWDSFEESWDFKLHPLISSNSIEEAYREWSNTCDKRINLVLNNEIEINKVVNEIYLLEDDMKEIVDREDISLRDANLLRDVKSLISYVVGCVFGRYSIDSQGLVYAGGEWNKEKYKRFIPDPDNIILITDEDYISDDVVDRFIECVKVVYGAETLQMNLDFIANTLGNKGNTSREVIREYFVRDFFKDHCKTYQKRPIYWLFDSGKHNGFKALVYMHRYNEDTIGNLRIDYLHKIQRIYENEIRRMQDVIDTSSNAREVSSATKRKDKLLKQLQETKDYDEKIAHLALARTSIDLDDGVKVNYEKVQTDRDGNKLEVLAKI